MINRAFVFGNGESRSNLDVNAFKQFGTVIGCNAIHRDYQVDILVATDPEMMSEICCSEYPEIGRCYFRQVEPLEIALKDEIISTLPEGSFRDDTVNIKDQSKVTKFLMIGTEEVDPRDIGKKEKSLTLLIPLSKDFDVRDLKQIQCDIIGPKPEDQQQTYEFTGPYAVNVGARFCEEVFIIGFDLSGQWNGKINNMYKGTDCYYTPESIENPKLPQSVQELKDVIRRCPTTTFYRVGPIMLEMVKEFANLPNIKFISFQEMCSKLNQPQEHFKIKAKKKDQVKSV